MTQRPADTRQTARLYAAASAEPVAPPQAPCFAHSEPFCWLCADEAHTDRKPVQRAPMQPWEY
jgi:hypothetical protein